MEMMRLFVGIQPSPDFREALSELQDRLRTLDVTARYYEPSNLHLTLAFIGMWSEDITGLLPCVTQPFPITLSHVGIFHKAKILWAGVRPSEELNTLAERVRNSLDKAEIPYDHQPFFPHITLGRKPIIPEGVDLSDIEVPPVTMIVQDVCLYRSDHRENGMEYTVIGRA